MAFLFGFRKYVDGTEHSIGSTPAFNPSISGYASYNTASENMLLSEKWNNAVVLSAPTTKETFQKYFKRTWIEEDGIDVYIPSEKTHSEASNDIIMFIYAENNTALKEYAKITKKLNNWGVFEYYDNYYNGLKRLVLENVDIIKEKERNGYRFIHFTLKCTNVLGYDIKNYNPSTGEVLWS